MKLNSIKLSGFKSFAELTQFHLFGQLVGVVGPNGCGKSNIMDAVRWVLGESKASELRGESMQDVIFSGTVTRKPASRASVELVFDNTDHRAGGQWGQFAEIAVKRVLTREGASNYFINNQVVRRRDIQDVFLGTGLGPRAYAIIGQGTISRIIESRPEELRLFLEEAAGVSKYKERRRETENRLSSTRENLVRVEDILQEMGVQLEKLEVQAAVAHQYHALQNSVELKQQQQWFLKREDAQNAVRMIQSEGLEALNALEAGIADLRHTEAFLEEIKQSHFTASEQVNQAQGKLYEASTEVGRLESEIRFASETRAKNEQRIKSIEDHLSDWRRRKSETEHEIEQTTELLAGAKEQAAVLQEQFDEQQDALPDLQERLEKANHNAIQQNKKVQQIQQSLHGIETEQRSLNEQIRQHSTRLERLQNEQSGLVAPDEGALQALGYRSKTLQEDIEIGTAQVMELEDSLAALEEQKEHELRSVVEYSKKEADLNAKVEALRSLQEKLQTNEKLQPWLQKHGLTHLSALWHRLHVDDEVEMALEAALSSKMGALSVSNLSMMAGFERDAPPAKMTFYTDTPGEAASKLASSDALRPLKGFIKAEDPVTQKTVDFWLDDYYVAKSLSEALQTQPQLQGNEKLVTRAGHLVDRLSISFYAQDSEQAGLLARAQEIDNFEKAQRAAHIILEEEKIRLNGVEMSLAQYKQSLAGLRQTLVQKKNEWHQLEMDIMRQAQLVRESSMRHEQLHLDLTEINEQINLLEDRLIESGTKFETLDFELATCQEKHVLLQDAQIEAQKALANFQEQHRAIERNLQEANFQLRTHTAREDELRRTSAMTHVQVSSLNAEHESLVQELAKLLASAAHTGLHDALEAKLAREKELAQCRIAYDSLTHQLRHQDEIRMQQEAGLEPMRQKITTLQLKEQAAKISFEQYAQFLTEANANVDSILSSIEDSHVKLSGLQGEIDRLHHEITLLGAVNLAAIEELARTQERKAYLDAQHEDLTRAIATLEDVIRKIDAETRGLLGNTFNQVNEHFGRMFPELFGGGHARLTMTGEEILDSGVQVMAQPPGKRNQSIQLLSGGEKALTAIALVFAIFQLNPAPFCLLDEVDAPLDDANTVRYAKLVSSMSRSTQFLFISHNKIAMEMAQQLIGVTMQELGVSRIVAVDMASALTMTE